MDKKQYTIKNILANLTMQYIISNKRKEDHIDAIKLTKP